MTSLFREILLPSIAAVGFFATAFDVATAGEAADVKPVQIAAAPVSSAPHQRAPTQPTGQADVSRPRNKPLEVERRCDRIERIGKFTITRCD